MTVTDFFLWVFSCDKGVPVDTVRTPAVVRQYLTCSASTQDLLNNVTFVEHVSQDIQEPASPPHVSLFDTNNVPGLPYTTNLPLARTSTIGIFVCFFWRWRRSDRIGCIVSCHRSQTSVSLCQDSRKCTSPFEFKMQEIGIWSNIAKYRVGHVRPWSEETKEQ